MVEFHNTRMGQKFFNADLPQLKNNVEGLTKSINRLCDILDPSNYEESLIPAYELDGALHKGAEYRGSVNIGNEVWAIVKHKK